MPYVLKELDVPIYTMPLTAALIELKLEEHDLLYNTQIFTKKVGSSFRLGAFTIEFINVNHSIPDAVALAIGTPIGTVIHTGDFKIDVTPIQGSMMDIARLGQLGNDGVLALLSDSTNVEKPGYSASERKVGASFNKLFMGCDKRIIITTFASNVHRLQQIIDVAAKYGRKVAITGRSMENVLHVASVLGYVKIPENVMVDLEKVNSLPREKTVIISTGSQGEAMSALYRMAFSQHKQIEVGPGDRVIISASAIPGNEKLVGRIINELAKMDVQVINDSSVEVHVSGHACQEELKLMMGIIKPKFFIPVHGEQKHLRKHAQLAMNMGIPKSNIFIPDNGVCLELSENGIKQLENIPAGQVFVDGSGVGDVGNVVLRDRKRLAEDGLIIVVATMDSYSGEIMAGPDIMTRGFVYVRESEELIDEAREIARYAIENCIYNNIRDWSTIKSKVRDEVSHLMYEKTKRSPMILSIIMEV